MPYSRRTLPRRLEDGEFLPPEHEEQAPPIASRAAKLSPAQVLALQRSGVGNRLLAREINGIDDEEEDEAAEHGGGGYPLLLTDRPWEEIERERALRNAPIPQAPAFGLELPIVIPAENLPPEMRAMFGLDQPLAPPQAEPEMPDIDEVEPTPEPEKTEAEPEKTEAEPEKTEAEPEKTEAEPEKTEAEPPPVTGTGKKKRKGKKGPPQQASPPPKPAEKPLHEMSIDDLVAAVSGPAKKEPAKKRTGAAKPPPPKKTAGQRAHEKAEAEKRQQKQAKDEALDRAAKEREAEERQKETTAVAALKPMLAHALTTLTGLRNGLPAGAAYNAIWTEADKGVTDLDAFNKGAAKTASSTELQAKLTEVNKLISKVKNFEPPETPQQRRDRHFNQITSNVPLRMDEATWAGPFGGQVDFAVDKNDAALRTRIRNHFGRDTVVVPNHDKHDYPGKTATSEVRYFVTGTSHTPSIAYDITLHVWDKNASNTWVKKPFDATHDAVHVLHIPHKDD